MTRHVHDRKLYSITRICLTCDALFKFNCGPEPLHAALRVVCLNGLYVESSRITSSLGAGPLFAETTGLARCGGWWVRPSMFMDWLVSLWHTFPSLLPGLTPDQRRDVIFVIDVCFSNQVTTFTAIHRRRSGRPEGVVCGMQPVNRDAGRPRSDALRARRQAGRVIRHAGLVGGI